MSGHVRTVCGDLESHELGATNYHEHLFHKSPLLPGDDLDNETLSHHEAQLLHASGCTTMVDATPLGMGRNPQAVARISEATGMHIVATTGLHRDEHYGSGHPLHEWSEQRLAQLFTSEVAKGMLTNEGDPTQATAQFTAQPTAQSARAGMLKAGIGYWRISIREQRTLLALAEAHRATGAPIMVHLEFCTAAHEVLDLLAGAGVASSRVVLAHADRNPDPVLHSELAARGAYLGYDGCARPRTRTDAELVSLTEAVVTAGYGDNIVLGGDVARRTRYIAYGGMPGLSYLMQRYVPRLTQAVGTDATHRMLHDNPARLLTLGTVTA
ncbi:phosphotriesterase family protein [Microbacterium sp. YY-01]|uniref:phosphotriesterase family protein n=1 Tax=Microbacterium sp. YY-01 TaxID=3421634 RepID=UPI003D17CA3D